MKRSARGRIAYVVIGAASIGLWAYYRSVFPYSSLHKCNRCLAMTLGVYAEDHGGKFPNAVGSAASLSLLYGVGADPSLLAGKGISDEDAERCFQENGKLTEEFCNWHYVPGLTLASDPGLALFWEKTGLMHNGQRGKEPAYEVCLVDGSAISVRKSQWPAFLAKQKELRKEAGL